LAKKALKKVGPAKKKGFYRGILQRKREGGHYFSLFVTFFKKALSLNDNILGILSR